MSNWQVVGNYLGRSVKISNFAPGEPVHRDSLESSVVLLSLQVELPPQMVRALVKELVSQQPMAVVVHGSEARAAFALLISELSDGTPRKHVMTKLSQTNDFGTAIEELLHSTWPSEDRFDDWTQYSIVVVGGDLHEVEASVRKRCS